MDPRLTAPPPDGKQEIGRREHATGRSVVAFRGAFWSTLSMSIPAFVNFLVFMVTSRILAPEDFGAVALAASITMLASSLGPIGFGEALVQRERLRAEHLDSVFWLGIGFGLLAYVVLVALSGVVASLFDVPVLVVLMPVLATRVVWDMATIVPNALIVRSMSFHLVALRTLFATLVAAVIAIALVVGGYGLWALVFAQLAQSFVKMVATFWTAGWRPRGRPRLLPLKDLSHYGLFASGNQFVQFLGSRADQILVGYVLGVTSVGIYNFARRIYQMTNDIISGALGTVSHPLFSEVQSDTEKMRRGLLVSTFFSAVLSFPVFVGIALVADRGIPLLFGDHWVAALQPVRLLCALGLISCIGTLQASLIRSRGKANWWFYYQSVSSLLNLVLVLVFARYGVTAMLAAMVTKTYLMWPIAVTMTLRLVDLRLADYARQFVAPLGAAAAMAAAVLLTRGTMGETSMLAGFLVDIGVGAITYMVVLFASAPRRITDMSGILYKAAKVR